MTQSLLTPAPIPAPAPGPVFITWNPSDLTGITLQAWNADHDIRTSYAPAEYQPSAGKKYINRCQCIGCGKPSDMDIGGMYGLCSLHWREYKELYEREVTIS